MSTTNLTGRNALVSLAYIKSGGKPIESISQLVYYSIIQSNIINYSLMQIQESMYTVCKLKLPVGIIKLCLKELCITKLIQYNERNKVYFQTKTNNGFDLASFESKMTLYSNTELYVSDAFNQYVKQKFRLNWTLDNARSAIVDFLICGENATTIFMGDQINSSIETSIDVKKSWYFASFIESEKSNMQIMGYIQDLAYGYAKCIGLLGSSDKDGNININQRLSGTEFYFDTKLILRFLGYSYESEVSATQELVNFIRNAGGLTKLFEKNLYEVGSALNRAATAVRRNQKIIEDDEMGFCISTNDKAQEISDKFGNSSQVDLLEIELNKKGFVVVDENSAKWNERRKNISNIDVTNLENFIADENSNWNKQSISNDVDAINRINRLRDGDYSIFFGGRRKIPVFVTSNYYLIRYIISYAKEPNINVNWGHWCLPLISDSLLTYSLWLRNERNSLNVENAILSKMTFALNHSDNKFRSRLIEETKRLQGTSPDNIPFIIETAHIDTLKDVISSTISATGGNADNLTPEIIIMSEKEAIANRTYQQKLENEKLIYENEKLLSERNALTTELNETKYRLREKEIARFTDQYRYNIPSSCIKKCLQHLLQVLGIIVAIFLAIRGYLIENKFIGIISGIITVALTFSINYFVPPYRKWINKLNINIFKNRLEKYLKNVEEKLRGKTIYVPEIISIIRKDTYSNYGIEEITSCDK
jgi:hypothetical protein